MKYQIWNLGSSSEGNCFIIQHKDCKDALMLECGLPYKQFKKHWVNALGAQFPPVVLISHDHLDHCKSWKNLSDFGIEICASEGTAEVLDDPFWCRIKRLRRNEWRTLSSFNKSYYEVFPLRSHHDAAEPYMYLIRAPKTDDILLFAIDTAEIPYDLHQFNITDMLIECNYMEELISEEVNPLHIERVRRSHMSLETLTEFFERQKFPNLQQITLCHLSQSNCDPMKAKETIMAATGVPVQVCAAKGGFIGN